MPAVHPHTQTDSPDVLRNNPARMFLVPGQPPGAHPWRNSSANLERALKPPFLNPDSPTAQGHQRFGLLKATQQPPGSYREAKKGGAFHEGARGWVLTQKVHSSHLVPFLVHATGDMERGRRKGCQGLAVSACFWCLG